MAGEYNVIRQIGRGGMAAVFLAFEIALQRDIAIKVMAPGLLYTEGMVERFMAEPGNFLKGPWWRSSRKHGKLIRIFVSALEILRRD